MDASLQTGCRSILKEEAARSIGKGVGWPLAKGLHTGFFTGESLADVLRGTCDVGNGTFGGSDPSISSTKLCTDLIGGISVSLFDSLFISGGLFCGSVALCDS